MASTVLLKHEKKNDRIAVVKGTILKEMAAEVMPILATFQWTIIEETTSIARELLSSQYKELIDDFLFLDHKEHYKKPTVKPRNERMCRHGSSL
jgi:hypothetical protein